VEMTRSESFRERAEGVRALGTLGTAEGLSDEGLSTVVGCLSDEEQWVREEAVIALYRIGTAEVIPFFEGAISDEDRHIRMYAEEAVERLGGS